MENNLLRLKLKQRLNKLASSDYTNLECWQEAELVNKAQTQWTRDLIRGVNQRNNGDESSKITIDDLNFLLTEKELKSSNKREFFETEVLPDNYFSFKKVVVIAKKDGCDRPKRIRCSLVEEANVEWLLDDTLRKPSFKWGETFCTLFGNKVRVWTGEDFTVEKATIVYYRKPRIISFEGCKDYNDVATSNQEIEFRDDIAEIIIDEAISIAAGDINDYNNSQRLAQTNQVKI